MIVRRVAKRPNGSIASHYGIGVSFADREGKTKCSGALVHSEEIFPSEEIEHSISASSVIYAHIIPSGKHEPQRENL